MSSFYFNGRSSSEFPIYVSEISTQILPTSKQNTVDIPGRDGVYTFGKDKGIRVEKIRIQTKTKSNIELWELKEQLAEWLDTELPVVFYYEFKPDRIYYATLSGDTDLKKIASVGETTLVFEIPDPNAVDDDEIVIPIAPTTTDPIAITNNGNVDAFPQIELTFNENTTEFAIYTDDEFIYFGKPAPVDTTVPTSERTLVLQDKGETTSGWSSGIAVDGGSIAGTLTSDGNFIRQSGNDYGSGSTWHGGALVKALGQQIQDFTVEYFINFKMTQPNQLGRIEIYLLDINNAVIGKMAMVDSTARSKSGRVEARLGTNKFLVNSEIGKEYYTNMYGRLYLQRIGQKYTFQIGKLDSKYNYFGRWNYTYYDTANAYQSKLAGIQIHIAQWGTSPVIPTMNINEIRVWNEKTLTSNQVPYVFENANGIKDVLFIDSMTATILKNGEPASNLLGDAGFDFPKLKPGITNLSITPPVASGTITFRERWK